MAPDDILPHRDEVEPSRWGSAVGAAVIGRNEGERLRRCLASVPAWVKHRVYVDSGSSDGSCAAAAEAGWTVIALDPRRPYTAARGRNEGFRWLSRAQPELAAIQFIDGDCELRAGWLEASAGFLEAHPDVAAVCGRRRERHPEASRFNRLCDLEWDTPLGAAQAFGGDVLIRLSAFVASGGYRESLIAGEDPELALRLRQAGHRIWRLDAEMTWHDAGLTRWRQWWQRCRRAGFAYAEGAALHGSLPERYAVAETRRAWLWGLVLPVLLLLASSLHPGPGSALLVAIYPAQMLRIALRLRRAGRPAPALQGVMFVLGRFPEAQGGVDYWLGRLSGQASRLIEYK
jgi:GT2 family glycosyltransferase